MWVFHCCHLLLICILAVILGRFQLLPIITSSYLDKTTCEVTIASSAFRLKYGNPYLLQTCRACLSEDSLFVVVTVYAVRASAIHAAQAMEDMMNGFGGKIEMGELVTCEQSAGRLLSQAVYARWEN